MKPEEREKLTRKLRDVVMRDVLEQREEIMRAFVAKHGFDPDECMQVWKPAEGKFWITQLPKHEVLSTRRNLILERIKRTKFTLWQRICLAMAGL